jgi:hypothetical protein
MSWTDVISAALGATQQGIAQQQQVDQRRKQLAIDAWEQQRRDDALEQEMLMRTINPGAPIDQTVADKALKYGLKSRMTTNKDGQLVWADTLEDTLQRKRIDQAVFMTQEAENKATMSAAEMKARDWITQNQDTFLQQPLEKRGLLWRSAGLQGNVPQSMEEIVEIAKANDLLPYTAAMARVQTVGQNKALDPLEQARLKQLEMDQLIPRFGGNPKYGAISIPKENREAYQKALQQLFANQPQTSASQLASPANSSGPSIGTIRELPDGRRVKWDGQGWEVIP